MAGFLTDAVLVALSPPATCCASRSPFEGANIHFVNTACGRVRCLVALPKQESQLKKSTVIISPDPPNLIEHQVPLIQNLVAQGFPVLAIEVPGYGYSVMSSAYQFSVEQISATIHEVFTSFKDLPPRALLALTCVIGLSAIDFAAQFPDDTFAVLLGQTGTLPQVQAWATAMDTNGRLSIPVFGQLMMRYNRVGIARGWYQAALPKEKQPWAQKELVPSSIHALQEDGACFCLASAFQAVLNQTPLPLPQTARKVPLAIVWGTKDRTHKVTDKSQFPKVYESIFDLKSFEEWPDCGHFPDLEEPLKFSNMILDLYTTADRTAKL